MLPTSSVDPLREFSAVGMVMFNAKLLGTACAAQFRRSCPGVDKLNCLNPQHVGTSDYAAMSAVPWLESQAKIVVSAQVPSHSFAFGHCVSLVIHWLPPELFAFDHKSSKSRRVAGKAQLSDTPAPPEYPAASSRDYCSGILTCPHPPLQPLRCDRKLGDDVRRAKRIVNRRGDGRPYCICTTFTRPLLIPSD